MSSASSRIEFSVWELMFVGENLAVLWSARSRKTIGPTRGDKVGVLERLRLLQADLENLELKRSEDVLRQKAQDLVDRLANPERQLRRLGPDAAEVRALAIEVWRTLQGEASARSVFVVQRSREGKVSTLLRNPVAYFGLRPDGPLGLTIQGLRDFQEAGRCYAVGFTAAAIMFMLRATEDVLRSYYLAVTRQRASGNWGNLVTVLEIPALECPKPLTDKLKQLLAKRNSAMHPKERVPAEWDEEAAEKVLSECREAILMMITDAFARQSRAGVTM